MDLNPTFRRFSDGYLRLDYTDEARKIQQASSGKKISNCLPPNIVRENAVKNVLRQSGDVGNELFVLGNYTVQFGVFRGQTFKWMLEHSLGYSAWFVDNMRGENPTSAPLSQNKFQFKKYVESFEEGKEAVLKKKEERISKTQPKIPQLSPPSKSTKVLSSLVTGRKLSPQSLKAKVNQLMKQKKIMPNLPSSTAQAYSTSKEIRELGDDELVSHVVNIESGQTASECADDLADNRGHLPTQPCTSKAMDTTSTDPPTSFAVHVQSSGQDFPLPDGWKPTIPKADQQWISKALFKPSKSGKAELDPLKIDKLWYYPPQPTLVCNQTPHIDRYYAQRLLLWMPKKLWRVKLHCPQTSCTEHELTSAGLYPRVRQVLDIDGYYNLAAEYLECSKCKRKVISWSGAIVQQLDIGHRMQFPVLLTYRYACDIRVIRMLRQRGLGNSSTQLQKKLTEQHTEAWLQKTTHYLTDCKAFVNANINKLVQLPTFEDPPELVPVPKYKWLLTVYCNDVMLRLDEVKASITSIFGRVLKLDSTKKVVKKLAGHGAGTASWATNIGNEYGQVLMSVLTSSEGCGLGPMIDGIVTRYENAGVASPELLYVDRGCCGETQLKVFFSKWPDLNIRLDVWHFMRRFSVACTTDAHQLYGIFMGRLSQCIFEWSNEDLEVLKEAKRHELKKQNIENPTDADVVRRITKKELSQHCRRKTRGVNETTRLLAQLLEAFDGDQGLDTMGVPLLDKDRIWNIWETQKHHITCIQDPEGIQLYTKTGSLLKGGVHLPIYRCARGSTSLESFHLHLNRFIPGTSASDTHFQTYLLEGLVRWNEDRASASLTGGAPELRTYSSLLRYTVNDLANTVLGQKIDQTFTGPRKYTGELIGIEYLYSQTGQVLQDFTLDPDSPEAAKLETEVRLHEVDEGFEEEEPIEDQTIASAEDVITPPSQSSPEHSSSQSPSSVVRSTNTTDMPSTDGKTSSLSSFPDESVGPDNIEGYGHVQALADYLLSIKDQSRAITNEQASQIIKLWNSLSLYDKMPTKFSPRHKTKLTSGRFKTSKTTVAPGVDSTKRCFLGQNTGPAQWPDCNRYVEAIIVKLCEAYPSPQRTKGVTTLRWTLISRAYKNIREIVLNNARIMSETGIQLVEINNATLTQWYNRRGKKQDKDILEQGITLSKPAVTAKEPLPTARTLPTTIQTVSSEQQHAFSLPSNTAGQGKARRKLLMSHSNAPTITATESAPPSVNMVPSFFPGAPHILPTISAVQSTSSPMYIVMPPQAQLQQNMSILQQNTSIPPSTQRYRKRKLQQELSGEFKRKYNRKTDIFICKQCGKERKTETHKQYYGNWYCQEKSTLPYEEWRQQMAAKGYGRKKQDN